MIQTCGDKSKIRTQSSCFWGGCERGRLLFLQQTFRMIWSLNSLFTFGLKHSKYCFFKTIKTYLENGFQHELFIVQFQALKRILKPYSQLLPYQDANSGPSISFSAQSPGRDGHRIVLPTFNRYETKHHPPLFADSSIFSPWRGHSLPVPQLENTH